jgi:hypothetical protein
VVKSEMGADGKPVLMKLPQVEFSNDGPGKPVGINRFIGRRPIFAFATATSKCWNGPPPATVRALRASCITLTPCASTPTAGNRRSAGSIRRSTRQRRKIGPSSI